MFSTNGCCFLGANQRLVSCMTCKCNPKGRACKPCTAHPTVLGAVRPNVLLFVITCYASALILLILYTIRIRRPAPVLEIRALGHLISGLTRLRAISRSVHSTSDTILSDGGSGRPQEALCSTGI